MLAIAKSLARNLKKIRKGTIVCRSRIGDLESKRSTRSFAVARSSDGTLVDAYV